VRFFDPLHRERLLAARQQHRARHDQRGTRHLLDAGYGIRCSAKCSSDAP
jgi:hypothetical protein